MNFLKFVKVCFIKVTDQAADFYDDSMQKLFVRYDKCLNIDDDKYVD